MSEVEQQVVQLPIPKNNEELRIFLILEDKELKAAYKEYILVTTQSAIEAERLARKKIQESLTDSPAPVLPTSKRIETL